MIAENIPQELLERVQNELEAGERIVWGGMPIPRFFTGASWFAVLFAIPWTGFSVFWMCMAAGFNQGGGGGGGFEILFALFGVPFVLIGLAMLLTPVWVYRAAKRTVYVLTDRRAITFEGGFRLKVRSYASKDLTRVYRVENRDGTGDVLFAQRNYRDSDGDRRVEELGFRQIDHVKEVERLVRQLAETVQPVEDQGAQAADNSMKS